MGLMGSLWFLDHKRPESNRICFKTEKCIVAIWFDRQMSCDDETCSIYWSVMKRVKYKVKSKVEIKGENVRMISNVQGPSPTTWSVSPLKRPDRGRPTSSGWLAPITYVYKEVGAGGTRYEVRRAPFSSPILPPDLGFHALVTGSFTAAILSPSTLTPPSPMASGSGSWTHGAGGSPLPSLGLSLSQISIR
jgi:hypothetical protein